jgi:cellulose synthase/poly-beta-1,6-N-acetylglucosamine synthase-like glycosyltransferase
MQEKINIWNFNPRVEIRLTWLGIATTLLASALLIYELGGIIIEDLSASAWTTLFAHLALALILLILIYGGLIYQVSRLSYLQRLLAHRPSSREQLETIYDKPAPSLTFLIPSYKEERSVVFMTVMSAALQEHPNRRITLLIDDPPRPGSAKDAADLARIRALPAEVQSLFDQPNERFQRELRSFQLRKAETAVVVREELDNLAHLYEEAADWISHHTKGYQADNQAEHVYLFKILHKYKVLHLRRARELRDCDNTSIQRIEREYKRLAALFNVEISGFERKRYENLSHEPNKAMNLNSYIGLLGKSLHERSAGVKIFLEETAARDATLQIPEADYLITLDADSVLLPDYALRLIEIMEHPRNASVAVAQTPYSAFPDPTCTLERIAGATTDIQYIIHQGFTGHSATYWVGANALIRRRALDDIMEQDTERGYPIQRFIQDRTVIEDTESTIDLIDRGWSLLNYPERLAYSATPPDFGSLLIQRRRWANGGLIILPKLLRYLARRNSGHSKLMEGFFRIHYLVSIAAVNIGLLVLLAIPFTNAIQSIWLPLTALPYFWLYRRDLMHLGYKGGDILRVYALNLLLIPANLGGVIKSIQQGILKTKVPFVRTPKVDGRTAAPAFFILLEYLLLVHWLIGAGVDIFNDRWTHGLFAAVNAALLFYAVNRFIGLRESREDLSIAYQQSRHQRARPTVAATTLASAR